MIGNLYDSKNLIQKLSLRKIQNMRAIQKSFYQSQKTQKLAIKGLPYAISIEPTTACNLRCPECPSGLRNFTRPTGKLSQELFQKIIDELKETLLYLTFYFQGEPYLHPQFLDMVQYAHQQKIYTATSTNAHFLDEEQAQKTIESGLDRLIISIDGTTQEVYEAYRKEGNLEKVIEGTQTLLDWKKKLGSQKPYVIFQFLVVRPNEHQIEEVKALGKKLGVDKVAFKTAQIYDYEKGSDLIPTIEKYARYRKMPSGKYEIKNKLLNQCWKMWHSCVITWDGQVVPCCFDKDAQHSFGQLTQESFQEIWQGKPYQAFRQQLLKGRSQIEICKNCTEGTKVWA